MHTTGWIKYTGAQVDIEFWTTAGRKHTVYLKLSYVQDNYLIRPLLIGRSHMAARAGA